MTTGAEADLATAAGPEVVRAIRDGAVESVHHGHAVVADSGGRVLAAVGVPDVAIYIRSAAKPFQTLGTLELTGAAGLDLDDDAIAIACASHLGTDAQQIEAGRLLALGDLTEMALRCPPALPADIATLIDQRVATPLAHNCSGKHAGFLLAQVVSGGDRLRYLDPASDLQRLIRSRLEAACGVAARGPGVDGCGAPAWRVPLYALAIGYARLAVPPGELAGLGLGRVRDAMTTRPDLIGGAGSDDTQFMLADAGIVAKRGAEAVLAAGYRHADGRGLGVAVKIADGGSRATAPVLATLLAALGAGVPAALLEPPVWGASRPVGHLAVTDAVRACAADPVLAQP